MSSPALVARVLGILEPGGAQLAALRLARALEAHGFATRLLAGDATPAGLALARARGFDVEVFAESAGLQWEPSEAFAAWLAPRLAGADLVHAHMFGAWWAAARALPPDVPLVASEHNRLTWPGRAHHREMRAVLPRLDLLFAHGPGATAYLRALGAPPDRLLPGRSSIEVDGTTPLRGLPARRIVMAARLTRDKAPDVLIEAVGRMTDPPPVLLLGDGPLMPTLRRRVAALGLEEVVVLPGWQAEPSRWLAGAAVHATPSREEAWSQSTVLAMALGVPVVASAVEALPEVLGGGRGILVPPEDPDALAAALEDVLAGRRVPDLAAARAYAAQFTPARAAEVYARRYRELLAGAGLRCTTFVAVTSSSSSGP